MSRLGQPPVPGQEHLGGWVDDVWRGEKCGEVGGWCPRLFAHLKEMLPVRSMLDIGCGTGASLKMAKRHGLDMNLCCGIEGDPSAIAAADESIRSRIILHDYCVAPALRYGEYDLCWSVEFLEHIDEAYLKNVLSDMRRCKVVVCTANPDASGGWHHTNCKAESYWINTFAIAGFTFSPFMTELVHSIARPDLEQSDPCCWFVARSSMFFRRD
jgi:SAM-dependent methyltransferase